MSAQLKSFIDRILRLKTEQDELSSDIRDIYAEAKATGFDKAALGQVVTYLRKCEKNGHAKVDEAGAIFETYLAKYQSGTPIATRAHAPDAPAAGNPAPASTSPQPRAHTISAPAAVQDGIPDFLDRRQTAVENRRS